MYKYICVYMNCSYIHANIYMCTYTYTSVSFSPTKTQAPAPYSELIHVYTHTSR